jgi:hypothetical protein
MSLGRISPQLPYIRKKAVEVSESELSDPRLGKAEYYGRNRQFLSHELPQIYQTRHPLVQQAGEEVPEIYLRNIFPDMRVTWGIHPNNLGHNDWPGCFRCHDGSHTSADGRTITNDCSACHQVLAAGEENPKILTDLGMK